MTLPSRFPKLHTPKHAKPTASPSDRLDPWIMASSDPATLRRLGIKAAGGGPHQSKTMMLAELSIMLAGGHGDDPADAVLEQNLLGKPSGRAREAALYRLRQLYALGEDAPVGLVMRGLWKLDPEARPLLALLCALARDPSLRAGAGAVLDAKLGEQVRWTAIAAAFDVVNAGCLAPTMAKSLAQNAASSWTQAGFLKGAVRKERVRSKATPVVASDAALLANLSGFGGARLLESRWLDVLDRPIEHRLILLQQAEGLGLARVRSAGDVLEIEVRRQMADAVGVRGLVNG
jgi:hypothetical protein